MKFEDQKHQMKQVMNSVEQLPDFTWAEISKLSYQKDYKKSDHFAEAGLPQTELAFISEGVFRSYYRNSDGEEYNKTFFLQNTFMLALTSVITGAENQINIQALTQARVIQLHYPAFIELFNSHPKLERLVRKVIEYEWVKKETREIRLVLNNGTERYKYFQEEHPGLEQIIPQYHIASYLGITPIQLSRIRAALAKK